MADGGDSGGGRTPQPTSRNDNLTPQATSASGSLSQQRLNSITNMNSTSRKAVRPTIALYPTNTWAVDNNQPIKSATLPQKRTWSPNDQSSSQPTFTGASPSYAHAASPLRSAYLSGSSAGAGAMNSPSFGRAPDILTPGTKSAQNIRFTQTAAYHNSGPLPSPLSQQVGGEMRRTDPPSQMPLGWPANHSSKGSASSASHVVPSAPSSNTPTFTTQPGAEPSSAHEQTSPTTSSVAISDHYTKAHPELAGNKGEVWQERPHTRSLRRTTKQGLDWVEAYSGALKSLSLLNPGTYQMPFGTRVVNIKTDFPANIIKAVRVGKYALMEKISRRIMQVWDAREDANEKVLFIFSINSSKRFCGVAEMAGPWGPNDTIGGWECHGDSEPAVGAIPLVWHFAKDVAYHQFKHIRQDNGHPVGNMWNGMNFPSELGRRVMEVYVQTPATSSILGHPKYQPEEDIMAPYGAAPSDTANWRGGFNSRGTRGGRGNFRGSAAFNSRHWRAPSNPYSNDSDESTPTGAQQSKPLTLPSGQQVSVGAMLKMNDAGQLGLQEGPSSAPMSNNFQGQAPNYMSSGTARGGINRSLHGARSLTSMRTGSANSSALQSGTNTSASATSATGFGLQQYPVQSPQQPMSANAYESTSYPALETPTHRPVHHASRMTGTNGSAAQHGLSNGSMSAQLLLARYHSISAEMFMVKHELHDLQPSTTEIPLLHAKLNRILAEKQGVEAQLVRSGITTIETLVPPRRDSFGSVTEAATSSTGNYNISPVRAEDGRVLQSASKVGSPPSSDDLGNFDRAPGGSARQKKGHAYKESFGDEFKRSINELLKSPEETPAQPLSNFESFNFLQDGMGGTSYGQQSSYPPSAARAGMSPGLVNAHNFYGLGGTPTQQNQFGRPGYAFSFPSPAGNNGMSPGFGNGQHFGNGQLFGGSSAGTPRPNNNGSSATPNGRSFHAPNGSTQSANDGGVNLGN